MTPPYKPQSAMEAASHSTFAEMPTDQTINLIQISGLIQIRI